MNFKINNTRELKSLHLLNKIKKLKLFLKESKSCGIFITSAHLHPIERIETHSKFLVHNLKITKISHKLIKILFKDTTQESWKNLLSGPIYLIEDNLNNLLTKENLNTILSYKKFTFRFLYLNQHMYRSDEVFKTLETIVTPIPLTKIFTQPKNILLF